MDWYKKLITIAGELVAVDEDMSRHTTFRAGGAARYYIPVATADMAAKLVVLHVKEEQPFFVMGNGSNLLVSDNGYKGTIIQIGKELSDITVTDAGIRAEAGALLSAVANVAAKHSLTGLEFASGIPGSIGGAVAMNAGAYGGEMKDVIRRVRVIDRTGNQRWLTLEELEFGYRTSVIQTQNYVVTEAELQLSHGDSHEIIQKMNTYKQARIEKQPLEYPSAGSTFKRPEGYFAGKLIMDAGLAGYQVGGAQVSEKHCGFVINKDGAAAADILKLIEDVSGIVKEKFGVTLEPEVKILGER